MPANEFIRPFVNAISTMNVYYEYWVEGDVFSNNVEDNSRVIHIRLNNTNDYNANVIVMLFNIRNQANNWKIASEGINTDRRSTCAIRNEAIELAKRKNWKYVGVGVVGEKYLANNFAYAEIIKEYFVCLESYTVGNRTVYNLTPSIEKLLANGMPDLYRFEYKDPGEVDTIAFVKHNYFLTYLANYESRQNQEVTYSLFKLNINVMNSAPKSLPELGQILRKMYDTAVNKKTGIHLFGIKYGKNIIENSFSISEIISESGLPKSYETELNNGICLYRAINRGEFGICESLDVEQSQDNCEEEDRNLLLYGVPGCGKSFYVNEHYRIKDEPQYAERVVFHPDYSYSDFVGQILPDNKDGTISYPFKPGPFTRILQRAINDKDHPYYLVIEEINRGNAPAIFGDIFQLLDRKENGVSDYAITNADIANAVFRKGEDDTTDYSEEKIVLPSNLYIIGTMNTADQNVFTLDTAFKRRWRMKQIPNDIEKCGYKDAIIGGEQDGHGWTWGAFMQGVNKVIEDPDNNAFNSGDKRLGAFFASEKEVAEIDAFCDKVIMYLWNDVFAMNRERMFKTGDFKTLDEVIVAFKKDNKSALNGDAAAKISSFVSAATAPDDEQE